MTHRALALLAAIFLSVSFHPPHANAADALDDKIEEASKQAQSSVDADHERGMKTLEGAVEDLEKTPPEKEKPAEARRLFLLGKAYFYLDRQDDAGKYLDKAIELSPENGEYHFIRGQAHAMNSDAAAAEIQFLKATELSPKEARYWYGLGLCEAGGQKVGDAIAAFKHAVEADPKHAKATLMIGAMLNQQGKRDEALVQFQKAAEIDPTYLLARSNIGQIYQIEGKNAEALAAFREILKIAPDDMRALAKAIQCEEALGQLKERDADHAAIVKVHAGGKVEDEFFCRDQFTVGKTKLMVFEYFELQGDHPVRYSFDVLDEAGEKIAYKISFGSAKFDNDIAREHGDIKGDERVYFLGADYPDGAHKTFGHYKKIEPGYDDLKKRVIAIVKGEVNPASSFTPGK
jgi:tetratricopeptide (TPR) repeat protein